MTTNKFLLFVLFSSIVLTSCKKQEVLEPSNIEIDTLVFGQYFGFCEGETCIEVFKLEGDKVYEDTKDVLPTEAAFYEGEFVELGQRYYEVSKDLVDSFPLDLLQETETVIGLPDAGDWGGVYIEYKTEDTHKFWLLDKNTNNVPDYLIDFIKEVGVKVDLMK